LLPTILFILGAYALYALVLIWCRWQRSRFLGSQGKGRPRWLTLAGGAGFLGLFLLLLFWLAPASSDHTMRLAGMLGVSDGDQALAKQASLKAATLQLDQKPAGGQPPYALLHPESPPSLLPPAKSLAGNQLRKPKAKKPSEQESEKAKAEARMSKKDKTPGKVKAKKKKTSLTPTMKSAWFG
jgi:hypothetical protein